MVTVQLSSSFGPLSAAIRLYTRSEYSHVDIVLPDGRLLGAQGDGVKVRPPNYQKFSRTLRLTAPNAPGSVVSLAMSQVGKRYDWSGLFAFATAAKKRRDWREEDRWFCSELVAWAFEKAGCPLLNPDAPVWYVSPRDVMMAPAWWKTN